MKIELNYTYDELITLLEGLNISLDKNCNALLLKREDTVPKQSYSSEKEYQYRFNAVKDLYNYLLTYE